MRYSLETCFRYQIAVNYCSFQISWPASVQIGKVLNSISGNFSASFTCVPTLTIRLWLHLSGASRIKSVRTVKHGNIYINWAWIWILDMHAKKLKLSNHALESRKCRDLFDVITLGNQRTLLMIAKKCGDRKFSMPSLRSGKKIQI